MNITECFDFQQYGDDSNCIGGKEYDSKFYKYSEQYDNNLCKDGSIGALCQDCDIYNQKTNYY
jgi:hypothetical protein